MASSISTVRQQLNHHISDKRPVDSGAPRSGSIDPLAQSSLSGITSADLTDALNHLQVIGRSECGWRGHSLLRKDGGKLLATDAPYVALLRAELGRLNDAEITQAEKRFKEFKKKKTGMSAIEMAALGGDDYVQVARGAIQRRNAYVERLLEKLVRAVSKREEAYQNYQPQHVIKKEEQIVNRVLLEIRNLASTYSSRRVEPPKPDSSKDFAIIAL